MGETLLSTGPPPNRCPSNTPAFSACKPSFRKIAGGDGVFFFMSIRQPLAFGLDDFQRRLNGIVFEVHDGSKADGAVAAAQDEQPQFVGTAPKAVAHLAIGQVKG